MNKAGHNLNRKQVQKQLSQMKAETARLRSTSTGITTLWEKYEEAQAGTWNRRIRTKQADASTTAEEEEDRHNEPIARDVLEEAREYLQQRGITQPWEDDPDSC